MTFQRSSFGRSAGLSIVVAALVSQAHAEDIPFAVAAISYDPGVGGAPGYTDVHSILGPPERFTGEGIFPSVVSEFSPPYGTDEILSIGSGGHVVVVFNQPVTDDPNNLYGIDLLIFGNTGLIDVDYPNGVVGGVFGNDGGVVEVSPNGKDWTPVNTVAADGPWPTIGYVDSGPYDTVPGTVLTDFTRPVDPALTLNDFMGLTHEQVIEKYRGSGGGAGIDLASTGLSSIQYVRISVPAGAKNVEIDALADVAPRLPGDVNLDGAVNAADLLAVINAWGAAVPGGPPADFNNDGLINAADLLTVINHWSAP